MKTSWRVCLSICGVLCCHEANLIAMYDRDGGVVKSSSVTYEWLSAGVKVRVRMKSGSSSA